jgi:hypothetical protein
MTTLREAAQQALEAMESISDCYVGDDDDAGECASCHERSYKPHAPDCKKQNAITALRAALAQDEPKGGGKLPPPLQAEPAQEPVAWMSPASESMIGKTDENYHIITTSKKTANNSIPLYTHPPRREWQVLTEEEIRATYGKDLNYRDGDYERFARAIETKLKEKNA